jgi:hypothetical protein
LACSLWLLAERNWGIPRGNFTIGLWLLANG